MKGLILFFLMLIPITTYGISLIWDPNSVEDRVSGYRVYYGLSSRTYDHTVEVRNGTSQFFSNDLFLANTLYYFAVTAFRDEDGLESDYSNEVTWLEPMNLKIQNTTIVAKVSPGNYLLESTKDFSSWSGLEARSTNEYSMIFNVLFDDTHRFYRVKRLEPEPMMAMASASKSMEKGLLLSVTKAQKLKTKESLTRKVKKFFRYNRRYEPDYRHGAELLMEKPKSPGDLISPPMPPRLK